MWSAQAACCRARHCPPGIAKASVRGQVQEVGVSVLAPGPLQDAPSEGMRHCGTTGAVSSANHEAESFLLLPFLAGRASIKAFGGTGAS